MMRRNRPEQDIHRAVIQHLELRAPKGAFWFHSPQGAGYCGDAQSGIFKGLGVVAGVPDLILIRGGKCYGLELKGDGGRVSTVQKACHARMLEAGAIVAVATGIDEALAQLEKWRFL